jgi:hypothetical protein
MLLLAGCDLVFHVRDLPDGGPGAEECSIPVGRDVDLTLGRSFTADRTVKRAVKELAGEVVEAVGNVDTNEAAAYRAILSPPIDVAFSAPQLAAGAAELVVRVDDGNTATSHFAIAVRTGEQWGAPVAIDLFEENGTNGLGVDPDSSTSPPIATPQRRMIVATLAGLHEMVESSAHRWTRRQLITPQALGVSFADHGMLTPDALHLVFAGQTGNTYKVYRSDRANPDAAFAGSTIAYDMPVGSASSPFFTADCQDHIYYSLNGTIHHVIVP